jgi:putative hemolysin
MMTFRAGGLMGLTDARTDWNDPASELILAPRDGSILRTEIDRLPSDQLLAQSGTYRVFIAASPQVENVLEEIGRLRELTFRAAGEGTGSAIDLSWFDRHYLHLFLWNDKSREVIGAYRIAQTDVVLRGLGARGLYTAELFDYSQKAMEILNPGLELGRLFIRPEYQKNYAALLLLWKGIARFVVRNPRYRKLFGAVSISNLYQVASQQLMVAYLRQNHFLEPPGQLVAAKNPPRHLMAAPRAVRKVAMLCRSIEDLSAVVSTIEADQKGVPVLLKQYLRLGAKVLGFNQDLDFGAVIDALVLLDLIECDPAAVGHYFEEGELRTIAQFHRDSQGARFNETVTDLRRA